MHGEMELKGTLVMCVNTIVLHQDTCKISVNTLKTQWLLTAPLKFAAVCLYVPNNSYNKQGFIPSVTLKFYRCDRHVLYSS
jgi:hypothetical protein